VGYLLQAIQLFRESHPELNFRVKLAGKGSKEQELRNYVLNAGLEKVVTFDGYIPYRALPGYIQKFNVAVYPSLRESFGVSLLEAQACGVPVIASNITPFRDVLINGKTGLLVPPCSAEKLCEAIVMLMNDRELRRQFGNAGRQFVMENYSLAACVSKQLSVYSQLV
jgi:glycosyltransferase involved in cell wall biosynthesis